MYVPKALTDILHNKKRRHIDSSNVNLLI